MNDKRIFISGKIGTYKVSEINEDVIKKFQQAETELKEIFPDCAIYNPLDYAEYVAKEDFPEQWLTRHLKNINIRTLTESTAIYLLTDWRSSAGALFEKEVADFLGLEIIYQKEKQ